MRDDLQTFEALTAGLGATWTIDALGGWCPVQGEGVVDGRPWYFRARGEHVEFSVAFEPGGDPVETGLGWAPGFSVCVAHGAWPDAGYLEDEEVQGYVARGVALYRMVRAQRHPALWLGPAAFADAPEQTAAELEARRLRIYELALRSNLVVAEDALAVIPGGHAGPEVRRAIGTALRMIRGSRSLVDPRYVAPAEPAVGIGGARAE